MSEIETAVEANKQYGKNYILGGLSSKPQRKLAIVTCMDTRLDVEDMLGLKVGEANILRNAGAIVTEDVMRSLIVSHRQLGSREIMIVGHTECGATGFENEEFVSELVKKTGTAAVSPEHFLNFKDVNEHVRRQVLKVRSHPWISDSVSVRGFVYNVKSGLPFSA